MVNMVLCVGTGREMGADIIIIQMYIDDCDILINFKL